jgi:hypothetical protein
VRQSKTEVKLVTASEAACSSVMGFRPITVLRTATRYAVVPNTFTRIGRQPDFWSFIPNGPAGSPHQSAPLSWRHLHVSERRVGCLVLPLPEWDRNQVGPSSEAAFSAKPPWCIVFLCSARLEGVPGPTDRVVAAENLGSSEGLPALSQGP